MHYRTKYLIIIFFAHSCLAMDRYRQDVLIPPPVNMSYIVNKEYIAAFAKFIKSLSHMQNLDALEEPLVQAALLQDPFDFLSGDSIGSLVSNKQKAAFFSSLTLAQKFFFIEALQQLNLAVFHSLKNTFPDIVSRQTIESIEQLEALSTNKLVMNTIGQVKDIITYILKNQKMIADQMTRLNESLESEFTEINNTPAGTKQPANDCSSPPLKSNDPKQAEAPPASSWLPNLRGYSDQLRTATAQFIDLSLLFRKVQSGTSSMVQIIPYFAPTPEPQIQAHLSKPHFWIYKLAYLLSELTSDASFSINLFELLKGKQWRQIFKDNAQADSFCFALNNLSQKQKQILSEAMIIYLKAVLSNHSDLQGTFYGPDALSRSQTDELIRTACIDDILLIKNNRQFFNTLEVRTKRIYLNICCIDITIRFLSSPSSFINKAFLSEDLFS